MQLVRYICSNAFIMQAPIYLSLVEGPWFSWLCKSASDPRAAAIYTWMPLTWQEASLAGLLTALAHRQNLCSIQILYDGMIFNRCSILDRVHPTYREVGAWSCFEQLVLVYFEPVITKIPPYMSTELYRTWPSNGVYPWPWLTPTPNAVRQASLTSPQPCSPQLCV